MLNQDPGPEESRDGPPDAKPPDGSFPVVGIGASAGGLEAFTQLLKALPVDTGMGFVLVSHLAPSHPSALAEILSRATRMPVTEVQDEPLVEPNRVYVIPPDRCMSIVGGVLQLLPREKTGVPRPIDHFFRSLAQDRRYLSIGVVLSGTASDGTLGLEAIKAEAGITFAQDSTAQHGGMPRSAIASGAVDFVLAPDEIAAELTRISRHPKIVARDAEVVTEEPQFSQVLQTLHATTGIDFSQYKPNTLYRRMTRRMLLHKVEGMEEYIDVLKRTPGEVDALYHDILIGVTSFFRDPEAFEALRDQVFPELARGRAGSETIRFWSLGCSTGQEAYSLAIAWSEFAESAGIKARFQLFATDLSEGSVEKARAGLYPRDIEQDVSSNRLKRFFTEMDGGYRITKSVRDCVVFSRHNALTDPPFSRIDLVSCRNLLIYLEPVLQQRLLPTLHYALHPGGTLWLGGSETIGGHRALFEVIDARHRIYRRNPGPRAAIPLSPPGLGRLPFGPPALRPPDAADLLRVADRLLSTRFAPPGVLVSADLDILQYRGDTSRYLAPVPGKASLNLLKMLREGLLVVVRAAIKRAEKEKGRVRTDQVRVSSIGGMLDVTVEVTPLGQADNSHAGYLILFEEEGRMAPEAEGPAISLTTPGESEDARMVQELSATREYLQSVIEQHEAANEELQSANEEVQSANEELQSVNEELETSKEEIQSSNEELVTVNEELNNRNAELTRVNNDLVNLLGSVHVPIVILGPDLRIRRFTGSAEKLLNLVSADVGRVFGDIRATFSGAPDLQPLLQAAMENESYRELDVQDHHGCWYSLRLRPYRTMDNRIDGVVLMLVDVDTVKRALEHTESIVATVREPLLVLDHDLRVVTASRSFHDVFRTTPDQVEGRLLQQVGQGQWNTPALLQVLENVLREDAKVTDYDMHAEFEAIGARTMRLNARRLIQTTPEKPLILLAIEDVTESDAARTALRDSEERFRVLFDLGPVAAFSCDCNGVLQNYNRRAAELWGREPAAGASAEEFSGPLLMEVLRTGVAIKDVEAVIERPDRSRISVIITFAPLKSAEGLVTGAITAFHDITGRKTAEEDQKQAAIQLRQYAADLSDADRHKNEFLAMLAHELRNPLAPITNAMRIIRLTGADPQALSGASAILERQLGQMVRLVDDLLDVSRISQGKLELRRELIDLGLVVAHAVEGVTPLCDSFRHELLVSVPDQPIHLMADRSRLAQVLGNLLNNACKFTEPGGRIELRVTRERDRAVISIRDTGIGIAPHELPRLFDMFAQADTSLARPSSGIGVGLTLVKTLVGLHGGTVEARSAGLGQGSEFIVSLEAVTEAHDLEAGPPKGVHPTAVRRRILVVDDNRDSTMSLAMLLQLEGHETIMAFDGAEAVQQAEKLRPEVVLLDIGLPKLNGYEVAAEIRKQPWGRTMHLVALTGWGGIEDRQKSEAAGIDDHLVKPVDMEALQKILGELPR